MQLRCTRSACSKVWTDETLYSFTAPVLRSSCHTTRRQQPQIIWSICRLSLELKPKSSNEESMVAWAGLGYKPS